MYQPKISDEHIRKLYQLKLKEKKPMTRLLDAILKQYFEDQRTEEEATNKSNQQQ